MPASASCSRRSGGPLLKAQAVLFVEHEAVENSEDLLAVGIDSLQRFAEGRLEVRGFQPLLQQRARHVDILPQRFNGMAAQKQPVKDCRFPLRRQWIDIFSRRHNY